MSINLIFKKSIANSLTIFNLILGFSSIVLIGLSLIDEYYYIDLACLLIFIATLFDVCDGKVARKLGTSGDFGKQIDSLADVVSFCLVPSFLLFFYFYNILGDFSLYIILISSFPLVFGAIRLAKFNTSSDESTKSYYLGLPTPANAIFISASILLVMDPSTFLIIEFGMIENSIIDFVKWSFGVIYTANEYILIIVSIISSILLVTNIRYSKFPIISFNTNKSNLLSIAGILIFSILLLIGILNKEYHIVILFFISYYIISGIIKLFISKINGELWKQRYL